MEIKFEKVNYISQAGTPLEYHILKDVSFQIYSGDFTAFVGHTGSGKSTVLQHFNGLLLPTTGMAKMGDFYLTADSTNKNLKPLRQQVGMVFQFPESQLFAETVAEDIAFGPQNFGVSKEEAYTIASEMIEVVGLDQSFLNQSPFDLSGGQMRRVAIAGVLAMKPKVLVLDEPTAGLDPKGQREMMELFFRLHREKQLTTILVTHQMDDVARYADQVIALERGSVAWSGKPHDLFSQRELLNSLQLDCPASTQFAKDLAQNPKWEEEMHNYPLPLTVQELAEIIVAIKAKEGDSDE